MINQKLIIVSAPSGAGKTTLVKHLLSSGLPLSFSVSATSRLPREGEMTGRDYYFLTLPEFRKKVDDGAFLEWEEVYPGTCYGTLKSEIDRIWNEGKAVVFDVDVMGGLTIKKIFGDKALSIFIQPPTLEELQHRLRNRSTESEEKIKTRLAKAEYELSFANQFDVTLINDDLLKAKTEIESLVRVFLEIQ